MDQCWPKILYFVVVYFIIDALAKSPSPDTKGEICQKQKSNTRSILLWWFEKVDCFSNCTYNRGHFFVFCFLFLPENLVWFWTFFKIWYFWQCLISGVKIQLFFGQWIRGSRLFFSKLKCLPFFFRRCGRRSCGYGRVGR